MVSDLPIATVVVVLITLIDPLDDTFYYNLNVRIERV